MPPRCAAARVAASKAQPKRERSSSLSDAPSPAPVKKRATKAKGPKWPPAGLEPESHPPRSGYPAFKFDRTIENGSLKHDASLPLFVGAHVSMAGGPASALLRASKAGANGVALFVKGHRAWKSKDLEPEAIEMFHKMMKSKEEGGELLAPRWEGADDQEWDIRPSRFWCMATISSTSVTPIRELEHRYITDRQ